MQRRSVAILLAVYQPRIDWLCELLDSLNAQTYPSLHLYVRDDCSKTIALDELRQILEEHITAFPFTVTRNEHNLGSNATFDALTRDATEDYVAYCDQDDVWLPEKIEVTVRLMEESPLSPTLVCTNVKVIDGDGKLLAERMEEHRKRHRFLRGEGLAAGLIHRKFVMGCTTLLRRETAVRYLPFPPMDQAVHDHYLSFRAACDGAIEVVEEPQMRYRVYGGNQTGVLSGVKTKEEYFERRILRFQKLLDCFSEHAELESLRVAREWLLAREANYRRERGSFRRLYRLRSVNPSESLFELVALRLPTPLFRLAVRAVQKGRV